MSNQRRIGLWLVLLLFAIGSAALAETPTTRPQGKTVRLLVIGNSFSGNALQFFRPLAEAGGHRLILAHAAISGSSFERHMKSVAAFEADPSDKAGKPYKLPGPDGKPQPASLRDMLQSQPWEYVTIQQASPLSFKPETYQPHADRLVAYVHKYAPQAKLLVHQTWAYRFDHDLFKAGKFTQRQMYERLTDGYQSLAKHIDAAGIIPSGAAVQLVREDPRWVEDIEYVDPTTLTTPLQLSHSLNADYFWTSTGDGKTGFVADRFHLSRAGCFVAGAVWCEFFFGDVRTNPFVPDKIPADEVAMFKEIAHQTVAEGKRPKLLPSTLPASVGK